MWKTSEIAGFAVTISYLSVAPVCAIVLDGTDSTGLFTGELAVFESDRTLRHLAFFEELAALDESDAEWRSVTAGMVVLRLVDAWMEDGPHAVNGDAWGLRAVRVAIEEIEPTVPARALLSSVVDAMEDAAVADMSAVAPRLLAYGRALEYDARYALAADVYRAVIAHTHPVDESDIATAAHLQLAACLRVSGNLSAAAEAYGVAGDIAQATDDVVGVLRARIGDARIAIQRGNLPRAEQLLDQAIDDSTDHDLVDVRSSALHERAGVAFFRGDYERSIQFAYEAMNTTTSPRERDRMLNDVATAFMRLGVLSAARDAYLVLTVTAQEQFTRWNATISLMEIAARSGSETLFERYRRELAEASMPSVLTVDYHIQAAEGYRLLGRTELACGHLERALGIASEHHFNQIVFYVEEALQRATVPVAPVAAFEPKSSNEVQEIAGAIRRMRDFAGAGG
jgi:tetratricopeptide (TPR) repeat protein